MIRLTLPTLTTKVADEAKGIVEAFVNTTNIEDSQRDVMEVGSWDDVISKARSGEVPWPSIVWGHEWHITTGKVLDAEEIRPGDARLKSLKAPKGVGALRILGQYNLETQRGREAFSDVKFGAIPSWSVGFFSGPDGEHYDNKGVRHVTKVGQWPEISNVLVGASPGTYTAIAKSVEQDADRNQRMEIANAILEHYIVTKNMEPPVEEAADDALEAVQTLIQQELARAGEPTTDEPVAPAEVDSPVEVPNPPPSDGDVAKYIAYALSLEPLVPPQHFDPDSSGTGEILTNFGRQNTR